MEWKRCFNCEYCFTENDGYGYDDSVCTRYPSWKNIYEPHCHWCGEWKEKKNKEGTDD